jgi:hypothetical protein
MKRTDLLGKTAIFPWMQRKFGLAHLIVMPAM